MASLVESEAHFKARAGEYGVPPGLLANLERAGICTLGHLAFAVNRPGQDFDETRFDQWLTEVNAQIAPSLGAIAAARRLHFEAEVILTASLKAAVEQPERDSAGPKPLPFAERSARLTHLQQTLPGLNVEGVYEPSMALVDECVFQYESRTLRYVEPSKCGSRETEIMLSRKDKQLKVDATASTLSLKETKHVPDEDVSSAYKLYLCFRRRAVAYAMSELFTFNTMEQYVDLLMKKLNVEPPPGYQATTIGQVLRADREVFVRLAQTVKDIRGTGGGPKPLDGALVQMLQDPSVMFHVVPLPSGAPPASSSYGANRDKPDSDGRTYGSEPYHGKGRGKGKSKQKKGGSAAAPRGFKNCTGRDSKGRPLCFDWNLGKCSKAPAGASCQKGRHNCFKFGCYKPRKYHEAHADEMPSNSAE